MFSVQFSSVTQSCQILCDPMNRSTPGLPVHHQLPELAQNHVHQVSDAIQPSHPLSSPFSSCLQSFPASGSFPMSQFFTSGGQKYQSFRFNISPSNEHSGLTFFRIDWLDILAVQGTLKSLLQHHSFSALSFLHSPTLTSIGSVMPSSQLILCRPLLLPSIPPSIRVFSNESALLTHIQIYFFKIR